MLLKAKTVGINLPIHESEKFRTKENKQRISSEEELHLARNIILSELLGFLPNTDIHLLNTIDSSCCITVE